MRLRVLFAASMTMLFASTVTAAESFYLKHNIWHYKKQSASTNYATDILVPINAKVIVEDEDSDELELRYEVSGTVFTVKLVKKHTPDLDIATIKSRLLGNNPVDLSKHDKKVAEAIQRGEVIPGMTKDEVLLARGYPPKIGTDSLEENHWTYWQNRWNRVIVSFTDGKVSNIKD